MLTDTMYKVDFNNISGSTSRFYLYCEDGYYSISSHNSIGSSSKVTMASPVDSTFGKLAILNINMGSLESGTNHYGNYGDYVDMYSCKVYSASNSLLYDLYPCYKVADGMAGAYDIVNRVFYSTNNTYTSNAIHAGGVYEGVLD